VIAEEFSSGKTSLDMIADILAGAVLKRASEGRNNGVAILAEGLAESIPESQLHRLGAIERDEHDHIRMSELDLGRGVKKQLEVRLAALGIKTTVVSKDIGYELRCADPTPMDIEYTRDLGYCAAKFLLEGGSNAMHVDAGRAFCSHRVRIHARPGHRQNAGAHRRHPFGALRDRAPLHGAAAPR
jgi:ATP-dependent phosphofructokinase / diphosphate-dependent phosphofructokinase